MNTLPEFLHKKKSASRHSKKLSDTFHGSQPLLASWVLDFVLTIGLSKVSGRHSIAWDDDFACVTGLDIDKIKLQNSYKLKLCRL